MVEGASISFGQGEGSRTSRPALRSRDEPYRLDVATSERAVWMHIALQLWADAKFRFSTGNDGWLKGRPYRLDRAKEVEPVAQHYGLGTNLIDWTWDPIVAACFAAHRLDVSSGDPVERMGRVYI